MPQIYFVNLWDIAERKQATELAGLIEVIFKEIQTNNYLFFLLDPEWHADVPINLAHVDCTDATSITNCTSGGWGRGLGEDPNGCHYPNATWLSCEK